MQLTEIAEQFEEMGLSVVAMTYDSVETLKTVEEDQGIEFTLLHDEAITHVNALGILNTDYEPDSRAYGVPYPGIFLVDPDGVIQAKFAEEDYRDRPDFEFVLEAAVRPIEVSLETGQSPRKARVIGMRAACSAGNRPPARPSESAQTMPVTRISGLTAKSNATWEKEPWFSVETV